MAKAIKCYVCRHPKQKQIDAALKEEVSQTEIWSIERKKFRLTPAASTIRSGPRERNRGTMGQEPILSRRGDNEDDEA